MYSALEAGRGAFVVTVATAPDAVDLPDGLWLDIEAAARTSGGTVLSISASTSSLRFRCRRSITKSLAV